MSTIAAVETSDIRFPTSASLAGSDAMNPDPDYSAAYLVLRTDDASEPAGHGFVFTIGRGNDVQVAAIRAVASQLVGRDAGDLLGDLGAVGRELVHDSQLRWLGPEKGVIHMAVGAVINALWDMRAKRAGQPLWRLLASLSPEEIVDLVDFRYLADALTREDALRILERAQPGRERRARELLATGYPAYTTSPGWLGYSDETLERLAREAVEDGFGQIKLKVGADLREDERRLALARRVVGPDIAIAVDANQRWEADEAIAAIRALAHHDLAWVEEPTSPDDVLAHARIARAIDPIAVATGEHLANRVMAKQFLLADALQILQIDATRVAGVNENVAMLLLAAKFGVRVCPHAGGVGLCELVQHLSMFDFVAVSGERTGRMIEFVDHLHEHFVTPARVHRGHYVAPLVAGSGAEMLPSSLAAHRVPAGRVPA